jgi:leucyl-tRNA synthetase
MIAALMEFTNYLTKVRETGTVDERDWKESLDSLLLLLAPTAPHLAEELWQRAGHDYSIHNQSWPQWDEELAKDEEITLVIQVNGKLRDRITVPASISEEEAKQLALDSQKVKAHLVGKGVLKAKGEVIKAEREITKVIYVPGRLVNLVVR